MVLRNHIATRFLKDDVLILELMEATHPEAWATKPDSWTEKQSSAMAEFYTLMNNKNQVAYYITNTVIDKLDMLKVEKKPGEWHDWTVFKNVKKGKYTFIFDENKLFRLWIDEDRVWICMVYFYIKEKGGIEGQIKWDMFHVELNNNEVSENFLTERVQSVETHIYKILCFMFLSENDEIFVEPGRKYGTKKSGKLINTLNVPITIVNSRWNTTVISNNKFNVRGHMRLQPYGPGMKMTKMIFIDPFTKEGYTRKAPKLN